MSATAIRFVTFVVLAAAAGALWVALFRSNGGTATATPVIPSFSSQSIFAPASQPSSGLTAGGVIHNVACKGCTVRVGSGGLVRAKVPSGGRTKTAYALLSLGSGAAHGPVLVHDVIGFGRGEAPVRRVSLLQLLDSSHRVIFELVAGPDRLLYLTSPAGGLRATSLALATGAVVPNDGVSGVSVDVALNSNEWVLVSVNGLRTARHRLSGAQTGAPRFLVAGVIGYKAPPHAPALTATHAQVSVSTPSVPAPSQSAAAGQPVSPAPPAKAATPLSPLSPPTISGSAVVGATLIADPGSWSDNSATFTFAWERCDGNGSCTAIDGAEGRVYELVRADTDAFVRVRVTAHVGDVSVSTASAPLGPVIPAAPTALTGPSISGDAVVGAKLTVNPGRWSDPEATITFAWHRCDDAGSCRTIDDAVGSTYIVSRDDLGSTLFVEVTASNRGGANEADSPATDVVVPAAPVVVTEPSIGGDTTVGAILTADPGTWSDPTAVFTYTWLRCHGNNGRCSTIDGADGTTYLLTSDDVGLNIEVAVTATNAGGTGTAESSRVGPVVPQPPTPPVVVTPPSVSGDATVGSTLTADPGTWSDPDATFTYAWLRCDGSGACAAIDGATDTTYVLGSDDVGSSVGVEVTASGIGGTGTADSNLIGPVVPQGPPVVLTAPAISGDPSVGSTLTADPGTWSDPDATFTYAWLRCQGNGHCAAIDGAAAGTYTLTDDDLGFSIRVEVTASGAGGTATAESTPTDPVRPAPPGPEPPAGDPSVVAESRSARR
jgi:hypothetical protein